MAPRPLVHLLGLCNVLAGALLVLAPSSAVPLAGATSPAARVFAGSAAAMLLSVAVAGWLLPATATRTYLWIFGVGVKVAGAVTWSAAAGFTGVPGLWAGALFDLAVAVAIGVGLRRGE